MIMINCSTPGCLAGFAGSASEAEAKGAWRIRQSGIFCPACVQGRLPVSHVSVSEFHALQKRITELEQDNAQLLTDLDEREMNRLDRDL